MTIEAQLEQTKQKLADLQAQQKEIQRAEDAEKQETQKKASAQAKKEKDATVAKNKILEALLNAKFLADNVPTTGVAVLANKGGVGISIQTSEYLGFASAGEYDLNSRQNSSPSAAAVNKFPLHDPKTPPALKKVVDYLKDNHGVDLKVAHENKRTTEGSWHRGPYHDSYEGERVYRNTASSIQLGKDELVAVIGQDIVDTVINSNLESTHNKAAVKRAPKRG